jgi:hypothetical protein
MMLSRCRDVMAKARSHCRQEQPSAGSDAEAYKIDHSGRSERELGVHIVVRMNTRLVPVVPTSGLAGFGAVTQRRFNDALHGAGTATAFNAAAEAAVDLPRIARKILCRTHGTADIVIAKDVAGTDNHGNGTTFADAEPSDI